MNMWIKNISWCYLAVCLVAGSSWAPSQRAALAQQPTRRALVKNTDLKKLQAEVVSVIEQVRPSVVGISLQGDFGTEGEGSGTIISSDGLVMTCGHVGMKAGVPCIIHLSDGTTFPGETLGQHLQGSEDCGLVKFDPGDHPIKWAALGDSDQLRPGQWIVTAGHTHGVEANRPPVVRLGRVTANVGAVINMDSPINVGDSGGAVFDLEGRLVGIAASAGQSPSENAATSINFAKSKLADLKRGEVSGYDLLEPGVKRRIDRSYRLLDRDRHEQAVELMKKCAADHLENPQAFYHLACAYGRWATTMPDNAQRRDVLQKAFDALKTSLSLGWSDFEHLSEDPDLELVRQLPEYPAMMQLQTIPDKGQDGEQGFTSGPKRTSRKVMDLFADSVRSVRPAMVMIRQGGDRVGYGLIVSGDGLLATKASLLGDSDTPIEVRLSDSRELPATHVATHEDIDLAILKIDASDLPAVRWGDATNLKLGSVLVSVGGRSRPLAMGARSLGPYTAYPKGMPFLGVGMDELDSEKADDLGLRGGVVIREVVPSSSARQAGVEVGDIVYKVDDTFVLERSDLPREIQSRRVGQRLELHLVRGERRMKLESVLKAHPEFSIDKPQGHNFQPVSENFAAGFGEVILHDSVIKPKDCGSALVNLDGEVVGMNIARVDRTQTYALPAHVIREAVKKWRQGSGARTPQLLPTLKPVVVPQVAVQQSVTIH